MKAAICICLALLSWTANAETAIFRCTNDGKTIFTNIPCDKEPKPSGLATPATAAKVGTPNVFEQAIMRGVICGTKAGAGFLLHGSNAKAISDSITCSLASNKENGKEAGERGRKEGGKESPRL